MIEYNNKTLSDTNKVPGIGSRFIKPSYSFETSQLPIKEQFDGYRNELPVFGQIDRTDGKRCSDGFFTDNKGFDLGGIHALSSRSDGFSFTRSARNVNAFDMDDWLLAVRTKGYVDADLDGNAVRFQGSRLELRNMGEPFSARLSANESLYFFLPREMLGGLEGILGHLSLSEKSQYLHPLLGHYLTALGSRLFRMTPAESLIAAETSEAMIRACVSRSSDAIVAAQVPILATRFEVARKFIESNLERPDLAAESVRATLCVSRRQIYKIFENHGGVERYIRSRRISACYRELQKPGEPRIISQVAEKYGFSDMANFSRQFRTEFGCNPSEVRETTESMSASTNYTEWLSRQ